MHSSYNAEHSLSQFMLKNGELLHQKVPGILKELIRILQEENDSNLVQKVNNLLACLRNLPGQPITVPDDIFLTEDDLFFFFFLYRPGRGTPTAVFTSAFLSLLLNTAIWYKMGKSGKPRLPVFLRIRKPGRLGRFL